jgi:hypothetical protein
MRKVAMKRYGMKTLVCVLGSVAFVTAVAFSRLAGANAPTGRYTASGGTVYDTKTKLTWQQTSPSAMYALQGGAAATYCAGLSATLGGSGWRVPTVKELLTIMDYSQLTNGMTMPPAVAWDSVFQFTGGGVPPLYYWSSTASAQNPLTAAWAVNFMNSAISPNPISSANAVRCVR